LYVYTAAPTAKATDKSLTTFFMALTDDLEINKTTNLAQLTDFLPCYCRKNSISAFFSITLLFAPVFTLDGKKYKKV